MKFSRFDTKKYNVHLDEKKIAVETWRVTNERNSLKCGWQENNSRVRVLKEHTITIALIVNPSNVQQKDYNSFSDSSHASRRVV